MTASVATEASNFFGTMTGVCRLDVHFALGQAMHRNGLRVFSGRWQGTCMPESQRMLSGISCCDLLSLVYLNLPPASLS